MGARNLFLYLRPIGYGQFHPGNLLEGLLPGSPPGLFQELLDHRLTKESARAKARQGATSPPRE
jgi:hypothetical protein